MKGLTITALFLALTVVALAKPVPVSNLDPTQVQTPTLARNDAGINIDPIGTMPERRYFEGSQFDAGSFTCRMQLSVFDKTRLAQSCN
jgi:hypothetical protein